MSSGPFCALVASSGGDENELAAALKEVEVELRKLSSLPAFLTGDAYKVVDIDNALANAAEYVRAPSSLHDKFAKASDSAMTVTRKMIRAENLSIATALTVFTALGRLQEMRRRRRVVSFLEGGREQARSCRSAAELFAKRLRLGKSGRALPFDDPGPWEMFAPENVDRHNTRVFRGGKLVVPAEALEWNRRYVITLLHRTAKSFLDSGRMNVGRRLLELVREHVALKVEEFDGAEGSEAGETQWRIPFDLAADLARAYERTGSRWDAIGILFLAWAGFRQRILEHGGVPRHETRRLPDVMRTLTKLLRRECQPNLGAYLEEDLHALLVGEGLHELAHRVATGETVERRELEGKRADLRFAVEREHPEAALSILEREGKASHLACQVSPWVVECLGDLERFSLGIANDLGVGRYDTELNQCDRQRVLLAMARLAEGFEPHRLGRIHLSIAEHAAQCHDKDDARSWLYRATRAARAARDSRTVARAYERLRLTAGLTEQERYKAARDLISYCGEWMSATRLASDKLELHKYLDKKLRLAIFSLERDSSREGGESVLMGLELLRSRVLTGLRTEIPAELLDSPGEWAQFRRELLKDWEKETTEEDESDRDGEPSSNIASWVARFVLESGWGVLRGRKPADRETVERLMESIGRRGAILWYVVHPEEEGTVLVVVASNIDGMELRVRSIKIPTAFKTLMKGVWMDVEEGEVQSSTRVASSAFLPLLADLIERMDWVCIVPDCVPMGQAGDGYDDSLAPFQVFGSEGAEGWSFLAEKVDIFYAFSVSHLAHQVLRSRMWFIDEAVLIGSHDLPAGVSWVEHGKQLADMFEGVKLVTSTEPEAALLALGAGAPARRFLYVIGHGEPSDGDPLSTGVRLLSSQGRERRLTAGRFLGRPVADLTVINACGVGRGRAVGSDFVGFPFAILQTANGACLAPMISCRSRFARWFGETLAGGIQAGYGGAHAFAKAVRVAIRDPELRDLSNWAPYFYFGHPLAGTAARCVPAVEPGGK